MWLKLFPDYHPPSADGDSSLGGILPTAFGGWKLFPSVYFLRNFSLMKYRLNGRIFTPGRTKIKVVPETFYHKDACLISSLDLSEINVNDMTGNNGAHQRSPHDLGIQK